MANLGCAVAIGRISRLDSGCWAIWIASLWLELAYSIGRSLAGDDSSVVIGLSLLLRPVSYTVFSPMAADMCSGPVSWGI